MVSLAGRVRQEAPAAETAALPDPPSSTRRRRAPASVVPCSALQGPLPALARWSRPLVDRPPPVAAGMAPARSLSSARGDCGTVCRSAECRWFRAARSSDGRPVPCGRWCSAARHKPRQLAWLSGRQDPAQRRRLSGHHTSCVGSALSRSPRSDRVLGCLGHHIRQDVNARTCAPTGGLPRRCHAAIPVQSCRSPAAFAHAGHQCPGQGSETGRPGHLQPECRRA